MLEKVITISDEISYLASRSEISRSIRLKK
jgi:hypothetical protein